MICYFIVSNIVVFLLWLVLFRPYSVHPHVDYATLAAFDLAPSGPAGGASNGLRYDLALNLTFFTDKFPINETFLKDQFDYAISFNHLTVGIYYSGSKIGPSDDTFQSFYQLPQQQHTIQPKLQGQASNVSSAVAEAFARERVNGWFNVDVRVKTTLTYRSWPYRATYYYEYDCLLRFRAPVANGTPAVTRGVKCSVSN
ncbi:hypothetical protein QOZ80_6AG0519680 [Eleusine coracana subsp. coracana]|nr:hypothetical protein QOZ80_6AG0519680 [Eleusine coracana subsp. coracana]